MVGDERSDAAHLGLEAIDEGEVLCQVTGRLIGGPHHHAHAHGVPKLAQVV